MKLSNILKYTVFFNIFLVTVCFAAAPKTSTTLNNGSCSNVIYHSDTATYSCISGSSNATLTATNEVVYALPYPSTGTTASYSVTCVLTPTPNVVNGASVFWDAIGITSNTSGSNPARYTLTTVPTPSSATSSTFLINVAIDNSNATEYPYLVFHENKYVGDGKLSDNVAIECTPNL